MPIRQIPGSDAEYCLIVFDEEGKERREPDGSLMSETIRQRITDASPGITDVFFASHGWMGDVPAAIRQYDAWIAAMRAVPHDSEAARERRPGFNPLIVGLHWPSLPWGEEDIPRAGPGLLSGTDIEAEVDAYAARIADTPRARAALRVILEGAELQADAHLSPALEAAYQTLFEESGLDAGDSSRPGADQEGFDPQAIMSEAQQVQTPAAPGVLGFGDKAREILLSPLRQLSFWKMKDRARAFGESGGHELLRKLQQAAPATRFHLMGHSFGCIVVSATVAGGKTSQPLLRPVDSLFLVQGALSLWAYAPDIPYSPGTAGYFHRIVKERLVRGPIVTTRSTKDTAVGRFYPLGAKLKKQLVLADTKFPKYGGIGSFGMQGMDVLDMAMQSAQHVYDFSGGRIYNLEASGIIKNGGGASGAHSDIAHPEVAHAFWSAILSDAQSSRHPPSPQPSPGTLSGGSAPAPSRPAAAAPAPAPRATRSSGGGPGAAPPSDAAEVRSPKRGKRPWLLGSEPAAASAPDTPRADTTGTFRGGREQPMPAPPPMASPPPPPPPPPPMAAPIPTRAGDAAPSAAEQRWFNVELEDHDRNEPLKARDWYVMAFDVDVQQRATALATSTVDDQALFPDDTDEVLLTIQLDGEDFEIAERTRPLRVPRAGRSRGRARFDISPLREGRLMIKATIHKEGNFIQQMEITMPVGASVLRQVEVKAVGRPPAAANVLQPRDIGLSMQPAADGYDCVVWGAVSSRARLKIQPAHLASAIDAVRRELLKLIMNENVNGEFVFQTGTDIPPAQRETALKTLARAGSLLFNKIFFGPAAGADSKAIGDFLRKMASDRSSRLKLQIIAESAPIPWSLLYVGDASAGAQLSWDNFLGMRHIIEQIPLQTTLSVSDCKIPTDQPELTVSVNVNDAIDAQMGVSVVADQKAFWDQARAKRKRVKVLGRNTAANVVKALASGETTDQILYFYCHAEAAGLDAPGGPDSSCLVLSDAKLTLGDLNLDAPTSAQLRGNPLVFINACESAELSPAFYDGFVPYFMAKGARGVVGTECKTPALFAAAWAQRFFEEFLNGGVLGEVFLNLRREFLDVHGNPLGLLYAVHCDGDTQVSPALI
jgi:hypothetical protein